MAGVYQYPVLPSQTEKGIRNVSYTIIIFLVVHLLIIGFLVALMPLIATFVLGGISGQPDATFLAAALTLVALACVLIIVYVVGLIFGLIGLMALHGGRDEFGPAHAQKVDRGIIVLILGIFLPVVIGAAANANSIGAGTIGLVPELNPVAAAVGLVGEAVGALLVGLFLFWTVEALAAPLLRTRAMIALILGIAAAVGAGAASVAIASTVQIPQNPSQFGNFYLFLIPGIIGAAVSFASLLVWYLTYRGILDRFKRGELRATPPVVYPPAYVSPYPAYGAPAYPSYPPPAPPPQEPPPSYPPPGP